MGNTVLKQQDFADAAGTAVSMLVERLSVHAEEWFVVPLSGFLKELCQKQRQGGIEPVFCVSISVLRTALLCGKPGYRLDAYGQDWPLYDRPLTTRFVECPWLTPLWSELNDHFQAVLDQQEIKKFCYPLLAEQAAWKCTGPLFSMMGSLLKYHMAPIKDDRAFRALVKGDEFRIEFGEFLDWKIVLAAEYPEVDLFNSRGRQFPHRQFQDKIFRHKKFYKFNLKGSVFRNCEFSDSTLEEASLGDCLFEQCRFKNVIFTDVLLAGAQFRECTLENVAFERVIASIAGMAPEKMDDWYRALSMLLTSMEHVRFSDCDLRGGQMEQCTTTYTVMENTLAEASDFAILLPNI